MKNRRKGVIMLHLPNPALNEEELELLDDAPGACLRQAVRRGALSLDEITKDLSPRVAAAVQHVAAGERPATRSVAQAPSRDPGLWERLLRILRGGDDAVRPMAERSAPPTAEPPTPEEPGGHEAGWMRRAVSPYAELAELLDEQSLTPAEAMEAAQAIDHALGRYLTGTRYAAP
jgi:hypothetical protein